MRDSEKDFLNEMKNLAEKAMASETLTDSELSYLRATMKELLNSKDEKTVEEAQALEIMLTLSGVVL